MYSSFFWFDQFYIKDPIKGNPKKELYNGDYIYIIYIYKPWKVLRTEQMIGCICDAAKERVKGFEVALIGIVDLPNCIIIHQYAFCMYSMLRALAPIYKTHIGITLFSRPPINA